MNHLNKLYSEACKPLLEGVNKPFFSQKQFEERYGKITILAGCRREIERKLNNYENTIAEKYFNSRAG